MILVSDFVAYGLHHSPGWNDIPALKILVVAFAVLIFISDRVDLISDSVDTPAHEVRILRRWFFCAAFAATLIALFYAEEDWRGKRAWEQCKHDLEAKGFEFDWDEYMPPPVPDDQNIFKASKMQEWFVGRGQKTNEISAFSTNRDTLYVGTPTNTVVTEVQARDFLAWSDQLVPTLDLIREALKRPYARMDGDYSQPAGDLPIPHFVAIRGVSALILAQRAHCYFLLRQPDKALEQLAFIHDMCPHRDICADRQAHDFGRRNDRNVAVIGVFYADTIGGGFRLQLSGRNRQLAALEQQLNVMSNSRRRLRKPLSRRTGVLRDFGSNANQLSGSADLVLPVLS